MDLEDFNQHTPEQRTALVWAEGTFLADRISENCTVCLYNMGKFFAEVWYRVADNKIQSVQGFNSNTVLELYVQMVDLSAVID